MKIVFMGTAELSCASLERLAHTEEFKLAAVVTQPDKPKGRELKSQPSPVKTLAQQLNLPILQPPGARDEPFISELRALKPDLIVVAAYGHILPPTILELPRLGCLNVHTSLLPKYRGAAPIQWAIADGETETGVTIMKMDAGMDTGDILTQRKTPILPDDNSSTLHSRLAQLGAGLLMETIPEYAAGKITPWPQPPGATYAPKIKKEDGHVDWSLPAQMVLNRLRAFTPWPGAFAFLPGTPKSNLLKIWRAELCENLISAGSSQPNAGTERSSPGEILTADSKGIIVKCGKDRLRILELQREGGRRMNASEFLAGHRLCPGEKIG